ncbi:hypothetical protein N7454_007151 [Penicillium verhagenii]|nr:hypothetical protein N7454_007151 [Penicillium verhagenii]
MAAFRGWGADLVRIFFYRGNTISDEHKQGLVALAFATARDQLVESKAILVRSDVHKSTINDGVHMIDPNGWHGTFAFKTSDQLLSEYHVAAHGYTNGKEDFNLQRATSTSEKADKTPVGGHSQIR